MKKLFLFISILLMLLVSCKSKPTVKTVTKPVVSKIFYDENWKISPEYKAEYYREVTLDKNENPIGEINDYLMTGEKYAMYEQAISFDKYDGSKSVFSGKCTIYHKNGEVKQSFEQDAQGKKQGWFEERNKNGKLIRRIEYKNDVAINEFEYNYPDIGSDESSVAIIQTLKTMKPVVHNANLPTPPEILFKKRTWRPKLWDYIDLFDLNNEKSALIEACNYDNDVVRNSAVELASYSSGNFNLGQICDIFDFSYQNWSYVNDPMTREYFAKASETIGNKFNGDCDDFAILMCSMMLAVGGEANINFAYDGNSGHAFSEVNIGTTNINEVNNYLKARYENFSKANYRVDDYGNKWLNLDWWANYPGGKYFNYSRGETFNVIYNTYKRF